MMKNKQIYPKLLSAALATTLCFGAVFPMITLPVNALDEETLVEEYLLDSGLSADDVDSLMHTYEIGKAQLEERAGQGEQDALEVQLIQNFGNFDELNAEDEDDDDDDTIVVNAPYYSTTNLAQTDHYIALINTDINRSMRGCVDFLFNSNYTDYDNSVLDYMGNSSYVTRLFPFYEDGDLGVSYKVVPNENTPDDDIMCLIKIDTGANVFSESDIYNSIAMTDTSNNGGFLYHTFAIGDVDHNGLVEAADVTILMNFIVQNYTDLQFSYTSGNHAYVSHVSIAAMDANFNDAIDIIDVIVINRLINGNEEDE